jgi:hypothetical protein
MWRSELDYEKRLQWKVSTTFLCVLRARQRMTQVHPCSTGPKHYWRTETLTGVGWVLKVGTWQSSSDRESGIKIPFPIQIKGSQSAPEHVGISSITWREDRQNVTRIYTDVRFHERTFRPDGKKRALDISIGIRWFTFDSDWEAIAIRKMKRNVTLSGLYLNGIFLDDDLLLSGFSVVWDGSSSCFLDDSFFGLCSYCFRTVGSLLLPRPPHFETCLQKRRMLVHCLRRTWPSLAVPLPHYPLSMQAWLLQQVPRRPYSLCESAWRFVLAIR